MNSILDKINAVKAILNKELESKNISDEQVIRISQKLDILILEYYNSLEKDKTDGEDDQL